MNESPLVIFGLDSADPEHILRWSEDGSLPTIASLLREGTHATLSGADAMSVHELWSTFMSGTPLEQHGNYGRTVLVPGTYRFDTNPRERSASAPFWARLAGGEKRVLILDVPDGRLVPDLRGTQIRGWGEHPTPEHAISLPADALAEADRVVGPRIATDERYWNAAWDRWNFRKILRRVDRKRALCEHLAERCPPDLAVVVFGDTHAAGHRFAKYGVAPNGSPRSSLTNALRETFQAVDAAIGRLLRGHASAPNVFVVSNCGIRYGDPVQKVLDVFLRKLGYVSRRPASSWGDRLRDFHDDELPPSSRAALARVLPTPLHSLLDHALEPSRIDWKKTTVFSIPGAYTGYLRVNLKGREPEGIVEPGEQCERLLDAVENDLRQLVDPSTGESVIEDVRRTRERLPSESSASLPDLFVHWRSHEKPLARISHPRFVLDQPFLAGRRANFHSREGIIVAAGPAIARNGKVGARAPQEFAPLFLRLLGETSLDSVPAAVRSAFLRPV